MFQAANKPPNATNNNRLQLRHRVLPIKEENNNSIELIKIIIDKNSILESNNNVIEH
jgi:hypothetical protein